MEKSYVGYYTMDKPRIVDSGCSEFLSRCSVVELYNMKFKVKDKIMAETSQKAVTKKIYLGLGSSLEGFEDIFCNVRHLSLD